MLGRERFAGGLDFRQEGVGEKLLAGIELIAYALFTPIEYHWAKFRLPWMSTKE
jgi:hypothetical protein